MSGVPRALGGALLLLAVGTSCDGRGMPTEPVAGAEKTSASETRVVTSEHARVSFPRDRTASAGVVTAHADPLIEATARAFGADAPFVVVTLRAGPGAHGGAAALGGFDIWVDGATGWHLAQVLAHETAHVLQFAASDLNWGTHEGAMRVLREGAAEWIGYEAALSETAGLSAEEVAELRLDRRVSRAVAALAVTRHGTDFDALFDDARLVSRFGSDAAYPLGEALVESMARACGPEVVGNVARAFAAPTGELRGRARIVERIASVGCDVDRVAAAWTALVEEGSRLDEALHVPSVVAWTATRAPDHVRVEARLDRSLEPTMTGWLRSRSRSGEAEHWHTRIEPCDVRSICFRLPLEDYDRATIAVGLEIRLRPGTARSVEPWHDVPLPPAVAAD